MLVKSSYLDQLILIAISESLGSGGFTGPINGASLALIAAGFTPQPTTTWDALTEATYSGYAKQTGVTWGVPLLQPDGTYTILSDLHTFSASGASGFVQNTIYGWALVTADSSPVVLMLEAFDNPVPITNPGDGFGLVIQLNEGASNPASQGTLIL